MPGLDAGRLDRRITLQKPVVVRTNGRPTTTWPDGDTIWADVRDVRPSRGEDLAEGLSFAKRPCRVIIRYRDDITAGMRFKLGERTMHIVSMPAVIGRRDGIEFMAQELTTAGQEG